MRLILIWAQINCPELFLKSGNQLLDAGGLFLLEKKVTDFLIEGDTIKGVVTSDNEKFNSPYVILATGHSARDIYDICRNRGVDA